MSNMRLFSPHVKGSAPANHMIFLPDGMVFPFGHKYSPTAHMSMGPTGRFSRQMAVCLDCGAHVYHPLGTRATNSRVNQKNQQTERQAGHPMAKKLSAQELYFARWLDLTLDNENIKRSALAQELGVHPSAISHWTGGKRPIPREKVAPLARILNVDPLALTVTAGIIEADVAQCEQLPMPAPDALIAKMRKSLSAQGLLTPEGLDRLTEVLQTLRDAMETGPGQRGGAEPPNQA